VNPVHGDKIPSGQAAVGPTPRQRKEFRSTSRFRQRNYCSVRKGGAVRAVEPSNIGESGSGLPTPIKLAGCPQGLAAGRQWN